MPVVMTTEELLDQKNPSSGMKATKEFEGFRGKVYKDTLGNPTVGFGFNLNDPEIKKQISPDIVSGRREMKISEAEPIFEKRYDIARKDAMSYIGPNVFNKLPEEKQNVIVDMSYNLGRNKLGGFKKFREAVIQGDDEKAAAELENSAWFKQVGRRSKHHVNVIRGNKRFGDLSFLNPFKVSDAYAEGESDVIDTERDIFTTDELFGTSKTEIEQSEPVNQEEDTAEIYTTEELLKSDPAKIQPKSANIFVESAKGALRGAQNVVSGTGGLMDILGQNISIDEKKASRLKELGLADDEYISNMNKVGARISQWGKTAKSFWDRAMREGIAAPDPALFSGEFMQNPSWTRAAAHIAEAVPSLGAATVASIAGGGNPIIGLGFLGALEGEQTFSEAKMAGTSLEKANLLFGMSAVGTAALEALPLTRFIRGGEGKLAKDIFIGAGQEGTEEVIQALWNNTIALFGYDKTRDLTKGMVEGLIAGAGSGGVVGGLTSGRASELDKTIKQAVKAGVPPEAIEAMQEAVTNQIITHKEEVEKAIIEKRKPEPPETAPEAPPEGVQPKAEEVPLAKGEIVQPNEVSQGKVGNVEGFVKAVNKKDWWRTAEPSQEAIAKRGLFLASSYKEAEFYGRPSDEPQKVNIINPLIGDEAFIAKTFGEEVLSEEGGLEGRFAQDERFATRARELGYDAIALMTPKGYQEFLKTGKIPRSIELNVLTTPTPLMEGKAGVVKEVIKPSTPPPPSGQVSQQTEEAISKEISEKKPRKKPVINVQRAVDRMDYRTLLKAGNVKFPEYLRKNFAPEEIKKLQFLFKKEGVDLDKYIQELNTQYPHLNIENDADMLRKAVDQIGKDLKSVVQSEESIELEYKKWLMENPETEQKEIDEITAEVDNDIEQEGWEDEIATGSTEEVKSDIEKESAPVPPQEPPSGRFPEPKSSKVTPSGQIRPELLPPERKELFQEEGELFQKPKPPSAEVREPVQSYQPQPSAGFVSKLLETISVRMPAAAHPDHIRGVLRSAGIKNEEIEFSDLDDYLRTKTKFTKDEIMDFIELNMVRVETVVKGSKIPTRSAEQWQSLIQEAERRGDFDEADRLTREWESAEGYAPSPEEEQQTKFQQYALPGGENYREVLVTLPVKTESYDTQAALKEIERRRLAGEISNEEADKLAKDSYRNKRSGLKTNLEQGSFRSIHFDEPNILVHLRTTDRKTPDGKKVLFIEEIQSDWHAKGKKAGYAEPANKPSYEEIEKVANDNGIFFNTLASGNVVLANKDMVSLGKAVYSSKQEALDKYFKGYPERFGGSQGVPNAPFKSTWHELALKQAVRMAVEEGYDGVAFINGEQTADRYDLSKQVDTVTVAKTPEGFEKGKIRVTAYKNGNIAIEKFVDDFKGVEELVGKDLALKAEKDLSDDKDQVMYEGQDLKFGGEWAKKFYDEILPRATEKYIKKWGGRIDDIDVGIVLEKDVGYHSAQAAKLLEDANLRAITQKGFLITPQMKNEILERGQYLFEKSKKYGKFRSETEAAHGSEAQKVQDAKKFTDALGNIRPAPGVQKKASTLAKEFNQKGFIDHTGQLVRNNQEAAELASAFRNPYVEQFQIIFLGADNKVKAHRVISSGGPNYVSMAGSTGGMAKFFQKILSTADRLGSEKVYLAHNHPTGIIIPSREDLSFTSTIGTWLQKRGIEVAAHIVIDHEEFSIIDANTLGSLKKFDKSKFLTPKERIVIKGVREEAIVSPQLAAGIARDLIIKDKSAVLYINSRNVVVAVDNIKNTTPSENIYQTIKSGMAANKAAMYFFVYGQGAVIPERLPAGAMDVIFLKDNGQFESRTDRTLKDNISVDTGVHEKNTFYGIQEEQMEYARRTFPKQKSYVPPPGRIESAAPQEFAYKSARTPEELANMVDQLNKFAQGQAILRKGANLRTAAGLFLPIPKKGEVKITQESLKDDQVYMSVLAHELGHSIEYNVVGKTNDKNLGLFGKNLPKETIEKLHKELRAVTEDISPGGLAGKLKIGDKYGADYFNKPAELIARFFEKMLVSSGNLEDMAPTALRLIEEQAVRHPIIQEFLEAVNNSIDKGQLKTVAMRDFRQMHHKFLGKRAGDRAYGDVMVWRAMKERGKIAIEKLIESKFKDVKDLPDALFRAAESIKISRGGMPEFGTRDFITAHSEEEENTFIDMGYVKTPDPVLEDGKAYPQYAKARYAPEEARKIFDSLSPEGKKLILDFTAERAEAKDYFNREIIKDINNIEGNIEGWVFHYFEDRPGSPIMGGEKFRRRMAGTRKHRQGTEGYVEDFKKAMTKVLVDLEGEKAFNDFIKRYFARVTRPLAEDREPIPGWIEVTGTLQTGVGLPQEKKITLIDKGTGEKIPVRQTRYQMPKPIYERFKLWRGLIDEATTAVRVVNDINRYWRINILFHPGTAATNFISGGIQYSMKILTDFYREVLTGNNKMPQTNRNISAMIKVLIQKGWNRAPDWVYGSDLSNFYGQFMKQKSIAGQAIDEYGNKALKLFSLYERYWKKVVLMADNVADIASLNEMTPEGLRIPTEEERELIRQLNEDVDLYAYDYDNVPAWLEAHQKSVMGQAIKPFAKYPYKYAKQVLSHVEAVFDGTLPWQDRVAKLLALTTFVAAYAMLSKKRKEEQETPVIEPSMDLPARLQTSGRLFVGTDKDGNEIFVRVAKYPFINLTEAGMQMVNGNWEGAKDLTSDMLGSIGPAAEIGMLAFNYRNKYNMYDPVPVILGENLVTFMPGYRILDHVSQMYDPFQRKQETFGQALAKILPTTDEKLQEKLHGKIRIEEVPEEGKITGAEGSRTTVDMKMKNYKQDILLSLLSGIYVRRIDPDIVEAYIIRKTKNLEKRRAKEE